MRVFIWSVMLIFGEICRLVVNMINSSMATKLIGESDCFLEVLEQASRLTSLNRPVLVVGERGTGKELVGERLHYLSARWRKPLIKMNCAAVNDSLLESELFGHEAGAFTGAARRHVGRFERAEGGTVFLDEVATMSLRTQEKLLRFVEYGQFERVGGDTTITVDVRLVAATNVDLPGLAKQNKFRHDLLDRLAFDVLTVPPLRARTEDILLLAEHFALNMCKELGYAFFAGFSPRVRETLVGYPWPGNVRELKNVIERSVFRAGETGEPLNEIQLDPFDSPYRIVSQNGSEGPSKEIPGQAMAEESSRVRLQLPLSLKEEVQTFERDLIVQALHSAQYNQRVAADLLGLSYHQLRGSLKKYGLLKLSQR